MPTLTQQSNPGGMSPKLSVLLPGTASKYAKLVRLQLRLKELHTARLLRKPPKGFPSLPVPVHSAGPQIRLPLPEGIRPLRV